MVEEVAGTALGCGFDEGKAVQGDTATATMKAVQGDTATATMTAVQV